MKTAALALAGLLGSAAASFQHNHHALFHRGAKAAPSAETCACSTYTEYYYGEATLIAQPQYAANNTAAPKVPLPTGEAKTLQPGTYTIPAKTVTVTEATTVAAKTTASVTPGVNTVGGVTTVVSTSTTVVCPYATTEASEGTVTEVLKTTTYVCPSAGTYTIAPVTTSVSVSTVVVVPVPQTYAPGTYTAPEQTVTVTTTDFVYYCPYTTNAAPAPAAPTYAPAPAPAKPTEAAPAPPKASAPSNNGGSSSGNIVTNGNQWAMTYTPYTQSGNCKSAGEVQSDIAVIKAKGFTTVRLYATDCSGLENVGGAAKANGLKLIIGIFINGSGVGGAAQQVTDIVSWGSRDNNWACVVMVVVGNEAVFNKFTSAGELAVFISTVKTTISASGYSGPVTTTEPLNVLQEIAGTICGVIDVVAANVQAFFNGGVSADQAGDFVAGQLELIAKACPGKEAYNLETGWPSQGTANGAAVPGGDQQQKAIQGILQKAGGKSVIFSFDDDHWKEGGPFGVEKFWGCAKSFSG